MLCCILFLVSYPGRLLPRDKAARLNPGLPTQYEMTAQTSLDEQDKARGGRWTDVVRSFSGRR